MNVLLTLLLAIGAIVGLLLIIGLFSKKDYEIKRAIVINRPKDVVFEYIKHIKNSNDYSKWVMTDPNSKREYKGTDGTEGFIYAWDSKMKNVGAGEQEIISITEGNRIVCEIRFKRPFEAISEAVMATESVTNESTKVTWSFSSSMKYPMNIMMLFMNFDKTLGGDMEVSLQNLKKLLEIN